MNSSGEKPGTAISFSDEDLIANNAGFLTPAQEEMLLRNMKSEWCAVGVAFVLIALTVLVSITRLQ